MFSARPARLGSVGQPERGKMSHEAKCLAIAVRPVVRSQSRRLQRGSPAERAYWSAASAIRAKAARYSGSRGGAVAAFSPVGRRCPSRPGVRNSRTGVLRTRVDGADGFHSGLFLIDCRERSTKTFFSAQLMRLVQCGATSTFLSSHQFLVSITR